LSARNNRSPVWRYGSPGNPRGPRTPGRDRSAARPAPLRKAGSPSRDLWHLAQGRGAPLSQTAVPPARRFQPTGWAQDIFERLPGYGLPRSFLSSFFGALGNDFFSLFYELIGPRAAVNALAGRKARKVACEERGNVLNMILC